MLSSESISAICCGLQWEGNRENAAGNWDGNVENMHIFVDGTKRVTNLDTVY